MREDMLFQKFLDLTDGKKLDYLYTLFVENDLTKLNKKYGPEELNVCIDDSIVTITSTNLKSARFYKKSMMMDGLILTNEKYTKTNNGYITTYDYEGVVAPICLN